MKKLIVVLGMLVSLTGANKAQAGFSVLTPGAVYNASPNRATDWNKGYSAVFVGSRLPQVDQATYLNRLSVHVAQVRALFGKTGLRGYMVYTDGDKEIAYINWVSKDVMSATFSSEIGKTIMGDAASFMHTDAFSDVSVDQLFKLFPTK